MDTPQTDTLYPLNMIYKNTFLVEFQFQFVVVKND